MSEVFEHGEHLERELAREPFAGPAVGSLSLHLAIGCLLVYYGWLMGLFHHNMWGNPGAGGSMQVTLVSSALPLPATQINQNVLATETPSQAPAAPSPKEQKHVDETAVPIVGKPTKPTPKNVPKTQQHQPAPKQNMAQYGEQAGSVMPHQMQVGSTGPTTVGDDNFQSLLPVVCGSDQSHDGAELGQEAGGSAHAERRACVPSLQHSPRRRREQYATGPVERQPHAGHFLRARRATSGNIWPAAVEL